MAKKNPFKKQSIIDTAMNVAVGGAANVAIDYVWETAGLDETLTIKGEDGTEKISAATMKNIIKVVGGAVAGSMISNKYARLAADGVAVVGVSNLIQGVIDSQSDNSNGSSSDPSGSSDTTTPTTGIRKGTIGRVNLGNKYFKSKRGTNGLQGVMGK